MATSTKTTISVLLLAAIVISVSAGDVDWVRTGRRIGDDEMLEFGGIPRRVLDTSSYISYDALKADTTPCSVRGASYYSNCQPSASANPYSRGCSIITQCRS